MQSERPSQEIGGRRWTLFPCRNAIPLWDMSFPWCALSQSLIPQNGKDIALAFRCSDGVNMWPKGPISFRELPTSSTEEKLTVIKINYRVHQPFVFNTETMLLGARGLRQGQYFPQEISGSSPTPGVRQNGCWQWAQYSLAQQPFASRQREKPEAIRYEWKNYKFPQCQHRPILVLNMKYGS